MSFAERHRSRLTNRSTYRIISWGQPLNSCESCYAGEQGRSLRAGKLSSICAGLCSPSGQTSYPRDQGSFNERTSCTCKHI